jgi:hypothetical protein
MAEERCSLCGGPGVLFFEGVERISPDGESIVTRCVVEQCDKCCKYPDDAAAMARARHAVREQHAVDHIGRSLLEEEDKRILSEMSAEPGMDAEERLVQELQYYERKRAACGKPAGHTSVRVLDREIELLKSAIELGCKTSGSST